MTAAHCQIAFSIGGVAGLLFGIVCAIIGLARGEWDIKRANDALNQPHGDLPNLDGNVLNSLHGKAD